MSYLICLTFIHIFQVQYLSRRHVMPFISSALFKNKIFHFIYLASSTQNAWSRSNRDKLSFKKLLSRIVSPFRVDVAGLLFSLPLIYEIYPRHIFSGNFSHEREFRDEVFVIAVNCTQSLSIPLVKKINKLRTIGESYPLSLFCKHPRKLSIDQAGNIEGTLCKSFKTRSGTITRITWSKTREII